MNKIDILLIIIWFTIGIIYGIKIHLPMFIDLNKINNNDEFDYITVTDILFLIPLTIIYGVLGFVSMLIYYLIQIQDKRIKIKRKFKENN